MLTASTKRKIDTARDILVGKIPVPTSQVEQITLALVYKFMSDMDKRAKDMGDSTGFFANGYSKYAWENLMDKALPARDRVLLYREALEKMSLNPHIPQLFRDVFRDASLPFNDPETLKLFLDVIDQFEYDHSEELGNAFEYLLQVMGSQGDAGQFRTPRHIIDFIVDVVDPSKTDRILDPACGTAGFLISAYNHIKEKGLSSDEMTQLSENFVGYDISQDMQRLSLVNMYLHHFPDPHIYEYDTLTSEDRWNDDFDVILANPPFMSPKGGIRPHNRFSVPSKRAEVLFVDYIMEHLTSRGKAGVIVPEGIIFQSQNAYKQLRKIMVEDDYLWAVVSLPSGVFNPYSGVKTSILLFDREIAKKTNKILFVKVENDGYDLGAQRRRIKKDDLPVAKALLKAYKQSVLEGKELEIDKVLELGGSISDKNQMQSYGFDLSADDHIELSQIINKAYHEVANKKIREGGEYNLSAERYVDQVTKNSEYEFVKISDVAEINPKKSEVSDLPDETKVSFVPMADVHEEEMYFSAEEVRKISDVYKGYTYFRDGDVLLAKITPCFENGKSGIAQGLKNGIGFGSTEYHVFRVDEEKIDAKYLYFMLNSKRFRELGKSNMTGSAGQKRVPTNFIKDFQIPLPPLSVQQEIVEELHRYQKIIDGARQVVDNYQSSFLIEDDWQWVELGEVCETFSGGTPRRNVSEYWNGTIPWVKTAEVDYGVIKDTQEKITELGLAESSAKIAEPGTILMALYGQGKTRARVARLGIKAAMNQACLAIVPNKDLDNDFLYYFLQTSYERLRNMSIGGNQSNLSASLVQKLKVPVPPLTKQQEIARRIQVEQQGIETIGEMIPVFEKKIEDRVATLWNEN